MANTCYTYFKITGDFEPDYVTRKTGLKPSKIWHIGDRRRDGGVSDFALWEFGRCDEYDPYVENMMKKTIEPLYSALDFLIEFKRNAKVDYTLQVVPSVYVEESAPCLAPSLEVMSFCCATQTNLDIDLYVYPKEDER